MDAAQAAGVPRLRRGEGVRSLRTVGDYVDVELLAWLNADGNACTPSTTYVHTHVHVYVHIPDDVVECHK